MYLWLPMRRIMIKYAILLLSALVLSACAIINPTADYSSVVQVKLPTGGWGSGVVLTNGRILTAAHVAVGQKELTIVEKDGDTYQAKVLWVGDPATDHDYAMLAAGTSTGTAVPYCGELKLGQEVVHVGYPALGSSPVRIRTYGRIASLDIGDLIRVFKNTVGIDILGGPGSSGGAIFSDGKLIGLLVGGANLGDYTRAIGGLALVVRPPESLCKR